MTDPVGAAPGQDAPPAPPVPQQRPEVLVGAAFAAGVAFALLLKRAGRVD